MILHDKILDHAADLMRHDHVYVLNGFKKTTTPSIKSSAVTDIVERYVPAHEALIDPSGKPRIKTVDGKEIFISLSHVDDILVVAVSRDFDLGVDVEKIRHRRYAQQIATRYFDTQPKNIYEFYRAWTAREAFIKAIGSRISLSLAHIHTKQSGDDLKIGLSDDHSHVVSFFSPQENYLVALCREKIAQRDFRVMTQISQEL
jgi:phosphopantetheinyl transferase